MMHRKTRRALSLTIVLSVLVSCGALRVSAQESPAPVSPDPAACTIEPRSLPSIAALWDGKPVPDSLPARAEVTIPIGSELDAVTRAAVTTTIHGIFACLNGPDMGRAFAYLTDDALVSNFGWAVQAIAQGESWVMNTRDQMPPEMRMTILALGPIMRLPDGRVGALVTFHDPNSDPETKIAALYLVLSLQGPIWQIDEVYPIQE